MKEIVILITLLYSLQVDCADTVYSKIVDKDNDNYEASLEAYKNSEFWPMWSMPIGIPHASSSLIALGENSYSVKKIIDYDLNTAWVEGDTSYGIGEYFEFTFDFPENTGYAGAYQFYGICNLFNGYCKSEKLWEANSRVKKLKVYYNNQFVCYVELCDTWRFQSFDIGKYFINRRDNKYMNANYEIKNGDTLKFEIIEVFEGSKYKDVAISEFLCEGAGN
jgi:hypothetical protein